MFLHGRSIGRSQLLLLAALAVGLVLAAAWIVGRNAGLASVETTHFVMDTVLTQTVFAAEEDAAKEAAEAAARLLTEMENQLSAHREGSEILAIAKGAGSEPVPVSEGTMALLERGIEVGERSGGLFDITLFPLTTLWSIGSEDFSIPDDRTIQSTLEKVDFRSLVLDLEEGTAYLPKEGQGVDLGGIAKGAALDRLRSFYTEQGIDHAIVSLGGNVMAVGGRPDGSAFSVVLRDPTREGMTVGTLALHHETISTSGGYERYSEADGVRYHHILHPETGYPAESDLLSVSVLGEDGTDCDWQSTWLFILGREKALAVAEELSLSTILIGADRVIHLTGEAEELFTLTSGDFTLG